MVRICVVGAGVVGLSTATLLQEAIPGASITVIGDRFLQDTVSNGAGGYFLPGPYCRGPNEEIAKKWLLDSYKHYKNILLSPDAEEAGIKSTSGYVYMTKSEEAEKNELIPLMVDEYRPCTQEELDKYFVKSGYFVKTLLAESRLYQPYLTRKFEERGGTILKRHLNSLEELADDFDLVCNCSGLGARQLCGDTEVTPVRGQVLKVRAPWLKHFFYLNGETYILPGFELVTVGGTAQFGSYRGEVSKSDSSEIWKRATTFLPILKKGKIEGEWVGFRPYRPTIRVEKEVMKFNSGKTLKVVHNYGHSFYGIMSAPGTSMHAVSLARDFILNPSSKL